VSRTRRTDLPETNWATNALCADMPAEIFDAAGDLVQTAKAACAHCPITRQCLCWAVSQEVEDEIWGGRTPRERRRLSMAFVLESPAAAAAEDKRPSVVAPMPAAAPVGLKSGTLRAPATPVVASPGRPKGTQPLRKSASSIRIPKTRTKAPAECGTEAGYKRHRRLGEETCADCRRAVRDAQEDRAARHAAGVPVATRAKVAPCGTPAGYSRHRNHREDPCAACRKANNEYLQAYRTATRSEAS
jgi:WhiB family transcriptional regulator, redox-sensing transcriptional regulator